MPHEKSATRRAGDLAGFAALTADLGLLYGGDYNPEQWDRRTWREDIRLMAGAGVNLVTVGVFSWARYEPRPGAREFAWLDEVLDLLGAAGIAVDLATPTASPPPWLGRLHPDTLPVDADGVRLVAGSRNQFSPASRVYREHALAITRDLVERYAGHPAVRMWHVGNELGQVCYGDESAAAFRRWLRARYGTVEALNEAWATTVWSQQYASFDEVLPPRRMPYHVNPSQSLDFRRYSSDQLRTLYREQRDVIRAVDPERPVTTNLMGFFALADYWSWARDLDVVADDAYPDPGDPRSPADAALTADLMRSLGGGRPWMLMEAAVGAVSWRDHNLPRSPERSRREALQAVAHGADGVCYFQWRASRAGAERFHSAMLPHAGADTRVHAGVVRVGGDLARLRDVVGQRVPARVVALFDWESWWAAEEQARPTGRLRTLDVLRAWYRVLWDAGVAVDLVHPDDLAITGSAGYDVVLVPQSYLLSPEAADALGRAASRGASVVVGCFTGVADRDAHVRTGRFPVLLADLLGVSGEEWAALPDAGVPLAGPLVGPDEPADAGPRAHVLGELLRTDGAEVLASYAVGHLAGAPAVTRRRVPRSDGVATAADAGCAWYVGTVLPEPLLRRVLADACERAGVSGVVPGLADLPDVEAVRRGDHLFVLNHSGAAAHVRIPGEHSDVLSGSVFTDLVDVPAGDVVVLTERNA
ncbi:beta-galactosidase [Isoptericola sp. S6320L]|uniref:beta-galactosidase n=1 Tax=Isoptericola sp. S6320L TaxID=2926411 RepID=UPI001FF3EEE4|nr:beta-galactosidase [Isoptericola sp. S6320L]MCK0116175.1 beta-galactosidase [Isoptericola sp. S6320L]